MAFGKARYLEMAKSLARSMELNSPGVPRAILTDSNDPNLARLFTYVIPYRAEFGDNMGPKFYLDRYTPFEETLYIDSDCLVIRKLNSFWQAFEKQSFGVPGWRILRKGDTDPYVDVPFVLDRLQLQEFPKFNGGAYYFRRSDETTRFFDTARDLLTKAKALRIGDFRDGGPSDEPIFALAMALHDLRPTSMGAGGMLTPIRSTGAVRLDVISGQCSFVKEGRSVSPDIIHFAGEYVACFAYPRECAKLKVHFEGGRLPFLGLSKAYLRSLRWQCSRKTRTLVRNILDRYISSKLCFRLID